MKKPKLEGVKNLLFDLGGVIMDIRRENCVKALEQLEVSGIGEMLGVYCQQGAFLQLEEGKITPTSFATMCAASLPAHSPTRKSTRRLTPFLWASQWHASMRSSRCATIIRYMCCQTPTP